MTETANSGGGAGLKEKMQALLWTVSDSQWGVASKWLRIWGEAQDRNKVRNIFGIISREYQTPGNTDNAHTDQKPRKHTQTKNQESGVHGTQDKGLKNFYGKLWGRRKSQGIINK